VTALLPGFVTAPLPGALLRLASTQSQPVIVKLVEPKTDPTGLSDIIIGSLGLAGVVALVTVALGAVIAGVLFYVRSRRPLR
jgi:ABC-type phosphate transport system permease subunit